MLLVLFGFSVVQISCQTLPLVHFYWKLPVDGDWSNKYNWAQPNGPPRSGHHVAHFDHIGAPSYRVNNSLPVIVGEVIVDDSVDLALNSTAGVLIDPWAVAPPRIQTMGQTLGYTIQVNVEDFSIADGTVQVYVVNRRTGDSEIINATYDPTSDFGEFYGSFMTHCDGENPISQVSDGVLNALPFDIIDLMYMNMATNRTANASVTLAFVDLFQERLGWTVVSTTLLNYVAQKTVRKLENLKQKIVYILHHLPPYEENDCCPNEEYRYPLDIAAFAERTYQFYTGNIFGPVQTLGCEPLVTYTDKISLYRDDLGPWQRSSLRETLSSSTNETVAYDSTLEDSAVQTLLQQTVPIHSVLKALFSETKYPA